MALIIVILVYIAIVASTVFVVILTNKPANPLTPMAELIRFDLIEKKYRNRKTRELLWWGKKRYM